MPSSTLPFTSGSAEIAVLPQDACSASATSLAVEEAKLKGPKLLLVWATAVVASWTCLFAVAYALYGVFQALAS